MAWPLLEMEGMMNGDYGQFLAQKAQLTGDHGFAPLWIPDVLFDFQRLLVEWALKKGRAAIFADCGLGKTRMQLAWARECADIMRKHYPKPPRMKKERVK